MAKKKAPTKAKTRKVPAKTHLLWQDRLGDLACGRSIRKSVVFSTDILEVNCRDCLVDTIKRIARKL